jgi:hypothetical protein
MTPGLSPHPFDMSLIDTETELPGFGETLILIFPSPRIFPPEQS